MIALVVLAPTAAQVLADVQQHYAKLPQLTMAFDENVTLAQFGHTTTSRGTMYLAKPNLFRADYVKTVAGKPKLDKDFIYDGKTLWVIDFMNLAVTGGAANPAIPAAASFLTNGNLANSYTASLGKTGNLVLVPKHPQADVAELDLAIDANHNVTESIVISPSGDRTDFVFSKTTTGLIPPGTFAFDPKSVPTYKVTMVKAAPPAPAKAPGAPKTP